MSSLFFDKIIEIIGKRINFEAVSNYAGTGFMNDSWKMIQENHPLYPVKENKKNGIYGMLKGIPVL